MNIVFDLGGVLFRWDPEALAAAHFPGAGERQLVLEKICGHRDWIALDRGSLTYEEASLRGAERTGLDRGRILRLLEGTGPHLAPMGETVALLGEVKAAGHGLYLLSNMHEPVVPVLERQDFMGLFDGRIYSCRVGMAKPDRAIYLSLLESYSLIPEETVFIDDMPGNLVEPAALGIRTIHFTGAAALREELAALGVIP